MRTVWRTMPYWLRRMIVRLTQPSFTVSAGAIIFDDSGRVLLLNHVLRPGKSGWGIPGGFLNDGEQPAKTVRREMLEEANLEIFDLRLFSAQTSGRHVEILYLARGNGEITKTSREIVEGKWFHLNDLPQALPGNQRRQIEIAIDSREKNEC